MAYVLSNRRDFWALDADYGTKDLINSVKSGKYLVPKLSVGARICSIYPWT